MLELLKRWFNLSLKQYRLNLIDKECDKYFDLKRKLKLQGAFVNLMVEEYKKIYGEDLRTPQKGGAE